MAEHQVALDDPADTGAIPPPPAQPVAIPPAAQYMSRWRFLLVLTGVWLVGAGAGAGLYFWWFHSPAKEVPVFAVLVFVVACVVGSLLTAMVQERPGIAAMALAMMSAPLAAGAALLYGAYVFGWIPR